MPRSARAGAVTATPAFAVATIEARIALLEGGAFADHARGRDSETATGRHLVGAAALAHICGRALARCDCRSPLIDAYLGRSFPRDDNDDVGAEDAEPWRVLTTSCCMSSVEM